MPEWNDRNRPLYMIGVAAELAGVHPQTLRAYEQKGLVTPQRTSGNTRMYSQADIERLSLINELTGEGINLARGSSASSTCRAVWSIAIRKSTTCTSGFAALPDRVHELETRESVNSLVQSPTAIVVRRPSSLL